VACCLIGGRGALDALDGDTAPTLSESTRRQAAEPAQAICASCPVVAECREASCGEYHGVWGGEPHYPPSVSARYRKRAS
jgi:hypothetical protein